MDSNTLQPFADAFTGSMAAGLGRGALLAVLFAGFGLAAGVALVVLADRRGLLRRDVRPWHWAARLHYVYVPVLLMLLGGTLGSVFAAHRAVGRAINRGSDGVGAYTRSYLPTLQAALDERLRRPRGSEVTMETLIAEQLQVADVRNPLVRGALYRLNLAVVHHALNQVPLPDAARGTVQALRHADLTAVDGRAFQSLPRALHHAADSFFFAKYVAVWLLFAPFLLIPLAEHTAHAGWRWHRRRTAPAAAHPHPHP
jgi:hypothetical protein